MIAFLIAALLHPAHAWDAKTFKKPAQVELQKKLNLVQFKVTQKSDTEPPFKNEYWDHKEPGIYVDVVSGEPLFSSVDKYDSGTGWPSFTQPLVKDNVTTKKDMSGGTLRIEVRSKNADSHLGHLFDDGPKPTGRRYCMNSAAMRFVPAAKLASEGYAEFASLFAKPAAPALAPGTAKAVFAGGCFWSIQKAFDKLKGKGVIKNVVGYSGGILKNPDYERVSAGGTGHYESVEVTYEPAKIKYETLLDFFFRNIDPTNPDGQFCDEGEHYRTVVFVDNQDETNKANRSIRMIAPLLKDGGIPMGIPQKATPEKVVATQVLGRKPFYPAEEEHQDYYLKNPDKYAAYERGCRRNARLEKIWGKAK